MRDKVVEAIKQVLSRAYHERQGFYTLVVGELKGTRVVICVGDSYAKVTLEEEAATLDCRDIEYQPYGLYAFAEDYAELAKKAVEKAELLALRSRRLMGHRPA